MKQEEKPFVVAIDGPNSSGKSTLAKALADKLNIVYIDTGAMYRALGYYFLQKGYEITPENAKKYMKDPKLEFGFKDGLTVVKVDGEDISNKIRTPEIGMAASDISKILEVREYLVYLQRNMVNKSSVVMEGRDIGSVVFPDAKVKIYLTADISKRARRRQKDYEKLGKNIDIEDVVNEINKRDNQDMTRENSPLIKVEDAVLLDNTDMTFEETIDRALEIIKEKLEN